MTLKKIAGILCSLEPKVLIKMTLEKIEGILCLLETIILMGWIFRTTILILFLTLYPKFIRSTYHLSSPFSLGFCPKLRCFPVFLIGLIFQVLFLIPSLGKKKLTSEAWGKAEKKKDGPQRWSPSSDGSHVLKMILSSLKFFFKVLSISSTSFSLFLL